MITLDDINAGIKELARRNPFVGLSHCQNMDRHIQNLGYQSRHHMKTYLSSQTTEGNHIFTDLMKQICATRLPSSNLKYGMLNFVNFDTGYITHYGDSIRVHDIFIGLDSKFYDVRVPSGDVDVKRVVPHYRMEVPVYIIESINELKTWEKSKWGCAIVSFELIESYYSVFFARKKQVTRHDDKEHVFKVKEARRNINQILIQSGLEIDDIL
ncbi:hypothetical protein ACED23_09100 [Vibrio splendidus]|uniref:Uncharacterized protein n=1 Tax=Vibrio splendidus TaxID=29497 RepID=A0ABV4LPH7_VIBSP